jgi:hypothetical protein
MSSKLNEDPIRDLLNKLFGNRDTAAPVTQGTHNAPPSGSEDNMDDVANTGDITPGQGYRAPAMSFADKYDRSPIKTYDLPPATTRSENPPGTENEPFDIADMEKQQAAQKSRDSLRDLFKRDTERQPVKVNTNPGTKPKYTGVTKAVDDAATWVGDKVDQGWDDVKDYFNNSNTAEPNAADSDSSWLDDVVNRYKRFYGAKDDVDTGVKSGAVEPQQPAQIGANDALKNLLSDPEFSKMLEPGEVDKLK